MSSPTELWKKWEGRVVDGKFPLRQWLGSSDHSAVFLTERPGAQKAAIKLIRAENLAQENVKEDAQLSRWASAAKLSHPHLIRLYECGRCTIDGTHLLYVVMENAEENLAEILPLRALAPDEVSAMLPPTAEALGYLHQSGFAHARIRPSNIMAVDDQLKISADGLGKTGEHIGSRAPSAYDAPELASSGLSPAADVWSLGVTLLAVLTQNEPKLQNSNGKPGDQGRVAVPESIPQPFREIARQCLQLDPLKRCTVADILSRLSTPALPTQTVQTHTPPAEAPVEARVEARMAQPRPKRWIVVPVIVAVLILMIWAGGKFTAHQPPVPVAETHSTSSPQPASALPPAATPAAQSPAPFSESKKPAQKRLVRGSVLQQVLPDVSRNAQNTITGHVKVSVQVSVDASGNVSQAKLVSAGPSKYFADRALAAARNWKFTPPQVDGQAAASEWTLRFHYGRAATQVFPAETKP
jgi:TonB family protein